MLLLFRLCASRVLQKLIRLIALCASGMIVNCPMLLLFRLCVYRVLRTSIRLIAFCASALTINCPMLLLCRLCVISRVANIDSANSL